MFQNVLLSVTEGTGKFVLRPFFFVLFVLRGVFGCFVFNFCLLAVVFMFVFVYHHCSGNSYMVLKDFVVTN